MTNLTKPEAEKVKNAIIEMSNSKTRMSAEKDLQKDIVSKLKEEYALTPAQINKLVDIHYKQNIADVLSTHEEFVELYDSVFNTSVSE